MTILRPLYMRMRCLNLESQNPWVFEQLLGHLCLRDPQSRLEMLSSQQFRRDKPSAFRGLLNYDLGFEC